MFQVRDFVRVAPHTDSWMQGFTSGMVIKVGRKWVTVAWSLNPSVTRKFAPSLLESDGRVDDSDQWWKVAR